MTIPDIGNPDGYQKKGVTGEAKRIVVKTKGIAKVAQIWARRSGLRRGPSQTSLPSAALGASRVNKSGVEQFEWSLITLVSVAWLLLLSQELFYKYSNELWKLVRTERKSKERTHPLPKPKSQRMGHPGAFTHSFLMIPIDCATRPPVSQVNTIGLLSCMATRIRSCMEAENCTSLGDR